MLYIINLYLPSASGHNVQTKKDMWEQLYNSLDIPMTDTIIIVGDLNVHMGNNSFVMDITCPYLICSHITLMGHTDAQG